jgi:hypothetical protein
LAGWLAPIPDQFARFGRIDRSSQEVTSRLNAMLYACHQQSVNGCYSQLLKRIERKYVIVTAEKSLSALEAVAIYKDLADVERGSRHLKDVLAMRPIYHQVEPRVRAHIFVAAPALLVQRLLERRLRDAGIEFSSARAMEGLSTVRHVTFRVEGEGRRGGVAGGPPDARRVLKALKIGELRPPMPPAEVAATVM